MDYNEECQYFMRLMFSGQYEEALKHFVDMNPDMVSVEHQKKLYDLLYPSKTKEAA